NSFVARPSINSSASGIYMSAASLSRDGRFAVINASTAQFGTGVMQLRVMERDLDDDTWVQIGSTITLWTVDAVIRQRSKALWHPDRDDLFVIMGYGTAGQTYGMSPLVYLLSGGTWTLQSDLPAPTGYTIYYGFNGW